MGDGAPDVTITSSSSIAVLIGNGDGTLRAPLATPFPAGKPIFADFNGDGRLDIAYSGSAAVVLAFGNGNGTFQEGPVLQAGLLYSAGLVSGDFNRDGKSDFASIRSDSASVQVFLGGTILRPGSLEHAREVHSRTNGLLPNHCHELRVRHREWGGDRN